MTTAMTAIRDLGTILCIWAHPDDETWAAAGIMANAVGQGQNVICVTATRGEKGVTDAKRWPSSQLGAIRTQELESALRVLGVSEHHWLGYIDGGCIDVNDSDAVAKIVPLIEASRPNTILTFGPDGMTGHPDHQTVGRWTELALAKTTHSKPIRLYHYVLSKEWYAGGGKQVADQFDVFFNIDKPRLVPEAEMDICLRLDGKDLDRKLEALRAHASQSTGLFDKCAPELLRDMMSCEGYVLAHSFAPQGKTR